ncbi:hypothetical protein C7T35_10355 [Variovorax sp. WS11]|uniref:LysR family transcriptional regulator n=1 Tax=Variovorax sp. WS11 TaxID=1105204 RepID=UPI000D0CF77F|nr:LysR family transcriptional regulator [Variovorax sp. WS11]NDZ12753.1 LysR family transcriptional regulator [Variovorax sp. WS11]PSL84690.1 hypothetical protein C7T35_10355 [Variovorax sp. WS11]
MNIKQIETFVRVVELGSFSAAAEALHASQSTISARIKDLERHLGTELFDRSFRRPQVTPKGRELFEHAQHLVEFTSSLTRTLRDPTALTGAVRLGVVDVVASTWLPRMVQSLRASHPNVSLHLDISLTRVLMDRLRSGHLDLAVVTGAVSDASLHQTLLGHDEFVWMAAPSLGVPDETLGPAELKRWPILMMPEDSHHFPVLKQWFRDAGTSVIAAASCNTMNVLAELATTGLGVTLLPRRCLGNQIAEGRLVVLKTTPAMARVPIYLVHRTDRVPVMEPAIAHAAKAASASRGELDGDTR